MADDTTNAVAQTGDATGKEAGAAATGDQNTGAGTGQQAGGNATQGGAEGAQGADERRFSQADVDRIIKERLADEKKRADKKAEEEKAKAAGEYQRLYEQEKAAREKADADLAAERIGSLRSRIAAKHNLPADLSDRLRGDTEAEIEADAKKLAASVTVRRSTGVDGGAGNTATTSADMNTRLRRAAGRQ